MLDGGQLGRGSSGVTAGEDGAHGAVRDFGCGGDLAVGEAEARGAVDGLVVVDVGFALALGGALDAAEDVGAQLIAARSSPTRSAAAIALSAAPARIAALAASATRWACSSTVAASSPH